MLQASAEDWNRGDLDGFLSTYQDSDSTTFVTQNGLIHGVGAIRERYRASYFKGGGPPQLLRFDELVVRPLDAGHAIVTGRYILTDRASGAAAGNGRFTLVLARTRAGWKIVHDHSSASS